MGNNLQKANSQNSTEVTGQQSETFYNKVISKMPKIPNWPYSKEGNQQKAVEETAKLKITDDKNNSQVERFSKNFKQENENHEFKMTENVVQTQEFSAFPSTTRKSESRYDSGPFNKSPNKFALAQAFKSDAEVAKSNFYEEAIQKGQRMKVKVQAEAIQDHDAKIDFVKPKTIFDDDLSAPLKLNEKSSKIYLKDIKPETILAYTQIADDKNSMNLDVNARNSFNPGERDVYPVKVKSSMNEMKNFDNNIQRSYVPLDTTNKKGITTSQISHERWNPRQEITQSGTSNSKVNFGISGMANEGIKTSQFNNEKWDSRQEVKQNGNNFLKNDFGISKTGNEAYSPVSDSLKTSQIRNERWNPRQEITKNELSNSKPNFKTTEIEDKSKINGGIYSRDAYIPVVSPSNIESQTNNLKKSIFDNDTKYSKSTLVDPAFKTTNNFQNEVQSGFKTTTNNTNQLIDGQKAQLNQKTDSMSNQLLLTKNEITNVGKVDIGKEVYEGETRFGLRHGKGTLTKANDYKYIGDFSNNTFHGKGVITYADGRKYEGEFKNGQKEGRGKFYDQLGNLERDGLWINDQQI